MGSTDCDCLVFDITLLIFQCVFNEVFDEKLDTFFVIRCTLGFVFDVIEFVIIVKTKENIQYSLFVAFGIFYMIFYAVLLGYYFQKNKVANGGFSFFFKFLSLHVAVLIFITCYGNEGVLLLSRSFNSVSDFLEGTVFVVSFVDILLDLGSICCKGVICWINCWNNCCDCKNSVNPE